MASLELVHLTVATSSSVAAVTAVGVDGVDIVTVLKDFTGLVEAAKFCHLNTFGPSSQHPSGSGLVHLT